MARKRLLDNSMAREVEAKEIEMKIASRKEAYVGLQRGIEKRQKRIKDKQKRIDDKQKLLQLEVRFLRRKYRMFTGKDRKEPANPLVFPESGTKVLSVYKRLTEPTDVLAVEEEPARHKLTGLQGLMSTDHCTSTEITGLQSTRMRIMPLPHSSIVTPVAELANQKRDLENNGLVSAQSPSKIKDGQNKKIKEDILVSPEYGAESITICRKPKETTEALAIKDKSAKHEFSGMQTLSSTDDRILPEMNGQQPSTMRIIQRFKVPCSPLVTPAAIDNRNEKIKADPLVYPEFSAKVISISRKPKELTEGLAVGDEPGRYEFIGMRPLPSTYDCTVPKMTGLQPSTMRIMAGSKVPHSSIVTPVVELANQKRELENNGLVSARKPSKVKDGQNKKIKADILVSPEYGAESITISRKPKETTEALAIKDKSTKHEFSGMQTLSSTDDSILPEMNGQEPSAMRRIPRFKLRCSPLVTPTAIDNRNEKIKADPLVSPEFSGKIISISQRPKEPTEGLAVGDEPGRYEFIGMRPLSSTDDCTVPKMTGLQPSSMRIMPGSKVPHSLLVTPTVESANKKRRLENNGLMVTSAQKPSKFKDGRNRKIKAYPLVSPEFKVRNISISRRPNEPHEALAIEDEPARYELTGMQPMLSTDDCTLPEMTRLQTSATRIMTAVPVHDKSLATPIVEPANKKRSLKYNGLVGAQKPSNVKDNRNKKIKATPLLPQECGVENLSISRIPKEPTEALPIDGPSRHVLMGLDLFLSSAAYTFHAEMSRLQHSATRMTPTITKLQSSLVIQNNALFSAQKLSEVKDIQRKKIKDKPQKPISVMEERGVGSFWDTIQCPEAF